MRTGIFRTVATGAFLAAMCITSLGQSKAFDPANMNTAVEACTDFFEYANGTWLKKTEIPASESRWGSFNVLADRNNAMVKEVLDKAVASNAKAGSNERLIGDYYATCMDEAAIDRASYDPIKTYLTRIDSINTAEDFAKTLAHLHDQGFPGVFSFGVGVDLKDSNTVLLNIGQGGLTLPNRDYYTNEDAKSVETRSKFLNYASRLFELSGDPATAATMNAAKVLEIQTRLAKASLTPVERRNPDNNYNKIAYSAAEKMTPEFSWDAYFAERGVPSVNEINVAPPKFFAEVDAMMKQIPIADWKTYLRHMVLNSAASSLAKPFRDEQFDFFGRYLSGQKEPQPRWKTCVQETNQQLAEALGMEYAKLAFKPEAKARMNELIDNLMAAMKDRIDALEWMGTDTKKEAQSKLSTFKRKIGYPDKLRGYEGLTIGRDGYAANQIAISRFNFKRSLQDLGKPRDKTRWPYSANTVNASYSSINNDITFPAGILQPPFFNPAADDAINYGAIGGVIGHEISHGFDDSGSRYDAAGNLKMWWTADDRKKFEERAACVVDQFSAYEVQPGLFMNGKLTLGENIGDFAGLTISYDAYQRSLKGKNSPKKIDGFTPDQRFFLGWAQVWAAKNTEARDRQQVQTDPHALPRWRVNGPLSNMPQFAKAFGCKAGQPMVRPNACQIW